MIAEYDLFSRWFRIADWCAFTLQKDGYEALVLSPLGKFPLSATALSELASRSHDYMHRKMAASLLGWIEAPRQQSISEFFKRESERDRNLPPEASERLECQSVVEDLVFSATRWARSDELLSPALEFLTDVVKRTVNGEYWNSSSYAMTTLISRDPENSAELLANFSKFANGSSPSHPSRPTLEQERKFADNLTKRNPNTLQAIENVLNAKDDALAAELDAESERALAEFLAIAGRFDAETRQRE